MHAQPVSHPVFTDVDHLCLAANLLAKMMSELHSLQSDNPRLTIAMAAAGHDLRQRLNILLETVELLTSGPSADRSGELSHRAKSLIFRLAEDLEQLACQAEQDQRHEMTSSEEARADGQGTLKVAASAAMRSAN